MAPPPLRWNSLPRRFQFLLAGVVLFLITIFTLGPPSSASVPTLDQVKEAAKHPHLPKVPHVLPSVEEVLNLAKPGHKGPPKQANSTVSSEYRIIKWITDFKWRNPYSSETTLDKNSAVLPPLQQRPPIYTFYDTRAKKDKAVRDAENRLILAWRRAWWAQGFRPQVLSRVEALQNPQHELVQRMDLAPNVEHEIMRWLAWDEMGGGIITNWLALPMAEHDNVMLSFLRRGEYPDLSRIDMLHHAVFYGDGAVVKAAVRKAINNPLLKNSTANSDKIGALVKKDGGVVVNLLAPEDVNVDTTKNGIAYYSKHVLGKKYGGKSRAVVEKMSNSTYPEGLELLSNLINAHLHLTFQETYPEGISIVKPLPEHTTALMYEAIDIARNLTQCPTSPMPKSCPPNRQNCKYCDPAHPMKMQLQPALVNSTKQYTIGTVPHPYTLTSLHYSRDSITPQFLRNEAKDRNMWLTALTDKIAAEGHSEQYRLVDFKTLVAARDKPSHSLWLTAERVEQTDLNWIFGFNLPQASYTKAEPPPNTPQELVLSPRPGNPSPIPDVKVPEERWIMNEEERLKKARNVLKSKDKNDVSVVEATEQWNMADAEAWRFARAFAARRRMERVKWEEEEKKFSGSEKKAGVHATPAGGRWHDRFS
ncbi:hypothetical protein DM02DRAFT_194222 [Periconia macrospinosa]|uniref:Uncharacterized protein n=1 Tax=Periconia macrospinosa TaxID=97972 RepID=A0A2V1D8E5_9PLEO|nr:hypothetical protein DM02DRAFT_194222 [Periconia macrospinosa]